MKIISEIYKLEGLYYGLDNHNLFKRVDRYKNKILLIVIFSTLFLFNLFEIIFHIIFFNLKKKSGEFSDFNRMITSAVSLINILVTLILSSLTIIKIKIKSSIFY